MSADAAHPRLAHARLAGERVVLRPVERGDAEGAFDVLHGNDAILRWLVWEGPDTLADLEASYGCWARHGDSGSDYQLAICERETGRFVGAIGPRFAGHAALGDVGYWLAPGAWGRGYMSEAVMLVTHLAFRHLGASAMYGYVFVGNGASRRVLERAGYRLEHTAVAMTIKRGVPIDEWYLAVARAEWEERFGEYRPVEEDVVLEGASIPESGPGRDPPER